MAQEVGEIIQTLIKFMTILLKREFKAAHQEDQAKKNGVKDNEATKEEVRMEKEEDESQKVCLL